MLARLTLVVTALLLAGVATAQLPASGIPQREPSTLEVLNQTIPDFTMQEGSLYEAIEFLQSVAANVNLEVRWKILEDAGVEPEKQNITLKLKNARLSQVLRDLMQQAGGGELLLAYRAVGKSIVISTQKDLGGEMVSKTYDLRDLLMGTAHFEAPQMDVSQALSQVGSGGSGGGSGSTIFGGSGTSGIKGTAGMTGDEGPEMQKILRIIKTTISPDSWEDNGGKGTINPFNGVIVVYNTPLVHQQIAGFVEEEGLGP
jgi:hypothetical protein